MERVARLAAAHATTLAYIHPFRAGNGRTLRQGLDNLVAEAKLHLDHEKLDRPRWHAAINRALVEPRDQRPLAETVQEMLVPRERLAERLAEVLRRRSAPTPQRGGRDLFD